MEEIKNTDIEIIEPENNLLDNNNLVNLTELQYTPIHTTLRYNNKEIHIFNPNDEESDELFKLAMQFSDVDSNSGQLKVNVPATIVVTKLLKVLTDLRIPEDQEEIDKIINNPNHLLTEIILIVTEIFQKLLEVKMRTLKIEKDTLEKVGLTEEKMTELLEKQKEISTLTIQAEKEAQETEKIKAQNNEEELRKIVQELHEEKTKNLELQAKLEENNIQPEKRKGRPKGSKNKVKEVAESKGDETTNA